MILAERRITPAQIQLFEQQGFLTVPAMFSSDEIQQILNTFMQENADGPVPGLSDHNTLDGRGFSSSDPLSFYPRMMHPHIHPELAVGTLARKYLLDSRLYDFLRVFVGDEPVAVQSMFYFKPPKARGKELHQDNYYLRVSPGTCTAAWIAVDDVDEENGGMKVVPGSHRTEVVCPQTSDPSVSFTTDYVPVPEGMEAVHCNMKAGDVLFFNGSLIHGSTPNTSNDRFRRSLIFHYVPESSREMSAMYKSHLRFDGSEVDSIAPATGGGPCGAAQADVFH